MDISAFVANLFEQYRSFNDVYPILGSMATASIIFPTAESASHLITDKKVNWRRVRYAAALAPLYGAYAYLSVGSGHLVGEYISAHPLAKAALGPNLIGLGFNLLFFTNNTIGERNDYQLRELGNHYTFFCKDLFLDRTRTRYQIIKEQISSCVPKKEYIYSALGTVTFWNAFQYANYSYIPQEMQTPATLGVAFGWTVLLSLWSLMGRRKVHNVYKEAEK